MNDNLRALSWPRERLQEAIRALALKSGLAGSGDEWAAIEPLESISEFIEIAAQNAKLEAQAVETAYVDIERQLQSMGPALVQIDAVEPQFLAVLHGGRKAVRVLAPDGKIYRPSLELVRAAVCDPLEAPLIAQVEDMLGRAGVPKLRRQRAREAILRERFGARPIQGIWILCLPAGADFWRQLRLVRVPQRVVTLAGLHAIQYTLWLIAWWLIGAAALSGNFERAWLTAWALLLLTLVPLRVTITWLQGVVAIGGGAMLKQRLFYGALHLDPDSIRHQGVGQLLGRVIESEEVEALALSGGFLGLVAVIELVFAAVVLGAGAGGAIHLVSLIAWIVFSAFTARAYFHRLRAWTDARLAMTHDLVESMVGHRTRLAQQSADNWHGEEDEALEKYLTESRAVDRYAAILQAAVPRGWVVLGLAGLIPAMSYGASGVPRLAVSIGGILLAWRAFKRLSAGVSQVLGAALAWSRVAPLFQAAARNERAASTGLAVPDRSKQYPEPIVEARNLVFRYQPRGEPVLRHCDLSIFKNERTILEGPSGGGKSTLVSLLTGMRYAESGSLEIGGRDSKQLGVRAWRRRVAAAPQFQENHVLAETFAFNLLMARDGVPSVEDVVEAEEIARELGLGELLERMPAGMLQMVGETGWQLSHGERSRMYIARALLQNADLVVLDESFAALDPENLKLVMQCVMKRARSLLVIAHR